LIGFSIATTDLLLVYDTYVYIFIPSLFFFFYAYIEKDYLFIFYMHFNQINLIVQKEQVNLLVRLEITGVTKVSSSNYGQTISTCLWSWGTRYNYIDYRGLNE
jgi:hypothetical protein